MLRSRLPTALSVHRSVSRAGTRAAVARRSMASATEHNQTATLSLGCFWHPDAVFSKLPGVTATEVGYTGGKSEQPTYQTVCGGDGHTESLQLTYDPSRLSYNDILKKFFEEHDPTRRSKAQYMSAVWVHDDKQKQAAKQMVQDLEQRYGKTLTTKIQPAQHWTAAEEYHQKYVEKSRRGRS